MATTEQHSLTPLQQLLAEREQQFSETGSYAGLTGELPF
jgi:hypothetical protein